VSDASILVRAPDNTIIRFPAGTPHAQIDSVMRAYHDAQYIKPGAGAMQRAMTNGLTFNNASNIDAALNAGLTGARNFIAHATGQPDAGYGMREAWQAQQMVDRTADQRFAAQHPVQNLVGNVAGAIINPANQAGAKFVSGAGSLPAAVARGVAVGAPEGAAYGLFGAQPGHRIAGAASGAVMGAATGGAAPIAAKGVEAGIDALGAIKNSVARMIGAADPQDVAVQRIAEAVQKDIKAGVDPQTVLERWAGASRPTLADVGGENLRSTVRDAATQGPARQTAQAYRDQVAADLQNHALGITDRLTPQGYLEGVAGNLPAEAAATSTQLASPPQLAAALEAVRSNNAATNYAGPYAAPIELQDLGVIQALRDPEGASAINRAIRGARARMDYGAQADLEALKNTAAGPTGNGQVWPTTGRALDRLQIAFGGQGRSLQASGANDIASGLFKRQALVNSLLDDTPGLADARADFRNLTSQIGALDTGQQVGRATPSVLAAALQDASPDALNAAKVGAVDALKTAVGAPNEGATGALNRLSSNTNTGLNMNVIFGPEDTAAWRRAIQAETDRMSNANFVAPNTGAPTAGRGLDALVSVLGHGAHAAKAVVGALTSGGPLNDAERSAIIDAALSPANDDLLQALLAAKRAPTLAPLAPYAIGPTTAVVTDAATR
jgi:hypothetical protein